MLCSISKEATNPAKSIFSNTIMIQFVEMTICDTLSKAFVKSNKDWLPILRVDARSLTASNTCVSQVCCFMKPCR